VNIPLHATACPRLLLNRKLVRLIRNCKYLWRSQRFLRDSNFNILCILSSPSSLGIVQSTLQNALTPLLEPHSLAFCSCSISDNFTSHDNLGYKTEGNSAILNGLNPRMSFHVPINILLFIFNTPFFYFHMNNGQPRRKCSYRFPITKSSYYFSFETWPNLHITLDNPYVNDSILLSVLNVYELHRLLPKMSIYILSDVHMINKHYLRQIDSIISSSSIFFTALATTELTNYQISNIFHGFIKQLFVETDCTNWGFIHYLANFRILVFPTQLLNDMIFYFDSIERSSHIKNLFKHVLSHCFLLKSAYSSQQKRWVKNNFYEISSPYSFIIINRKICKHVIYD